MRKGSTKHAACTSKNDDGQSDSNKSSRPYDRDSDRVATRSDDEDHLPTGSPSRALMTTKDPQKPDLRAPTTPTIHHP